MGKQACLAACTKCPFGNAPGQLLVTPENQVLTESKPSATIMDNKPMVNIPPFGMCSSPSNPAVIAATAAAMGTFTPAPCMPVTTAPWVPGAPDKLIGNLPALTNESKLICMWGGAINIENPGQTSSDVD